MSTFVIACRLRLTKKAVTAFMRHPFDPVDITGGFESIFKGWEKQEAITEASQFTFKQVKHALAYIVDETFSHTDLGGMIISQQSSAQSLYFYREFTCWRPKEIVLCFHILAMAISHYSLSSPTYAVLLKSEVLRADKILSMLSIGKEKAVFVPKSHFNKKPKQLSIILDDLKAVQKVYRQARKIGFMTALKDRAYVHQQVSQVARYPASPTTSSQEKRQQQETQQMLDVLFKWKDEQTLQANELAHTLLITLWQSRYPHIPMPTISNLRAECTQSSLIIFTSEWREGGSLHAPLSLCERVWFRLGWPMLYDSESHPNHMAVIDQFDFINDSCATQMVQLSAHWPEGERLVLMATFHNEMLEPSSHDATVWVHGKAYNPSSLHSFSVSTREAILADESDIFINTWFGGRKSASRMLLLGRLGEMFSDHRPLQKASILREAALVVRDAHWENPKTLLKRGRFLLDQVATNTHPAIERQAQTLRGQMVEWCVKFGLYEEALVLLEQSTHTGPDLSRQFYLRWCCRRSLGQEAEDDWYVYAHQVERLIQHSNDATWGIYENMSFSTMLLTRRIRGLLAAAKALGLLRDGWPTAHKSGRKKPKPPSHHQATVYEQQRQACIDEAKIQINQLVSSHDEKNKYVHHLHQHYTQWVAELD